MNCRSVLSYFLLFLMSGPIMARDVCFFASSLKVVSPDVFQVKDWQQDDTTYTISLLSALCPCLQNNTVATINSFLTRLSEVDVDQQNGTIVCLESVQVTSDLRIISAEGFVSKSAP